MAGVIGMRPTIGRLASHDIGPMATRRRLMPMARNARTTCGSNWVPAPAVSSARASAGVRRSRPAPGSVMASKASATVTMRADNAISSPARPFG